MKSRRQTLRPLARRDGPAYRIRAAADDAAEVLIYDYIGWGGVEAQPFVRDLKAITASTIHVRLNTPGGGVFDGVAIYNALRDHPATIVTHIDGLAASIGSIIALAGDEVRMGPGAFFMIHDPWTFAIGNAAELRKTADVLEKIAGSLEDTYVKKSGAERDEIVAWMRDETWFTAQEALDAGFIDAIEDPDEDAAEDDASAHFDLSIFAKTPAALLQPAAAQPARSGTPTKLEVERALRDAGVSRSEAKAFVAKAYDAIAPRNADATALHAGLTQLITLISPTGV